MEQLVAAVLTQAKLPAGGAGFDANVVLDHYFQTLKALRAKRPQLLQL
jgi:hypothetical protein